MRWLPPDIQVSVISDRTTTIRASVEDVQFTMLVTIVLVLMVVLIFMRRLIPTVAAAVTVPLSISGTLAGMWFMGYTIDNFSLMALTVSVGFVVDDAIVMIENIVRHAERGMPPLQAAILGARQIGFTVMSISISLVAVFIPLIFMGGILGRLFHEFAMTLTMAIAVSAVVSLSLTPMICGRYMTVAAPTGGHGLVWRGIDRVLTGIERFYARTLNWALAHRVVHAAGHPADDRADHPDVWPGAERLHAGAGHRHHHGLDRGRSERLVPDHGGPPAPGGGCAAGGPGDRHRGLLGRRGHRLVAR